MSEKIEILKKWITKNGGYINKKLYLVEFSKGNRGIFTSDLIEKNEKILYIPKEICISRKNIIDIPKCEHLNLTKYSNDFYSIIVLLFHLFILKEKSFFFPYLNLLPTFDDFSYHPLCHVKEKEKEWNNISEYISSRLKNTYNTAESNIKNVKEICLEYDIIPNEFLTFENLFWCALILQTRQWGDTGLVPFADLLQHSNESGIFLSGNGTMIANNEIKKNEPVYDNYGLLDDVGLFVNFGFVDKSTKNNIFIIQPQYNIQINNMLNKIIKNEIDEFKNNKFFISTNGISVNLIQFVRILCLNESDLLKMKDIKYYENVISLDNEQKVNMNITNIFKTLLGNDNPNEIIKLYLDENSLEHKIAYLNLKYKELLKLSIKIIVIQWIKTLKVPIDMEILIK